MSFTMQIYDLIFISQAIFQKIQKNTKFKCREINDNIIFVKKA